MFSRGYQASDVRHIHHEIRADRVRNLPHSGKIDNPRIYGSTRHYKLRAFLTRQFREQIKEPMAPRLTLTDVEGNRYDIPDVAALDPASRRWLDARL